MKDGNRQVTAYERQNITPNLKVTAWQRFLSAFTQDNPYTSEDDQLRSQAQTRITHWQGERQRMARLKEDRKRKDAKPRKQAALTPHGGTTWRDSVTGMEIRKGARWIIRNGLSRRCGGMPSQ